jgi:DNA-binding GntR family transcriptional regulator
MPPRWAAPSRTMRSAQLVKLTPRPPPISVDVGVYRLCTLLDAISDGSLAPGQRITQEDIAEQLACRASRCCRRCACSRRTASSRRAGARRAGVAAGRALDRKVYQVRGALDALAARLAAERAQRIDPALIARGRKARRARTCRP